MSEAAVSLIAGPDRCQEASIHSSAVYIPCNAPATKVVGWKGRSDTPIRMCDACANHNVRSRGGVVLRAYVPGEAKRS